MPTYRKLHARILDSESFNTMPDDFTRLTWALLPLVLDAEGRGVDSAAWVRSHVYPMRDDVTLQQVKTAMDWFEAHSMIVRYRVAERSCFFVPTFKTYQGDTSKEARSTLPAPPAEVTTNSRPTLELVVSSSSTEAEAEVFTSTSTEAEEGADNNGGAILSPFAQLSVTVANIIGLPEYTGGAPAWNEAIREMYDAGATAADVATAVSELRASRTGYRIVRARSIVTAVLSVIGKRRGNGHSVRVEDQLNEVIEA